MRQPDWFTAATLPTAATRSTTATIRPASATAPTTATVATAASFGGMFSQVQNEVDKYIRHGGGALSSASSASAGGAAAPSAAAALTPEGLAYLQASAPGGALAAINAGGNRPASQQAFLDAIQPWAEETGQRLGVAPELVAAHAALESGWGQRPLLQGNGSDTNNLFGIKAGAQWRGAVADAMTTEYDSGAALKKTERFRSYPDQASAFRDYAQVLLDNPRYRAALGTGSDAQAFAQGLARGGYATDPSYADKLAKLASRLQQAKLQGE